VFGNASVIALNQDPAGNQAVVAFDSNDIQILVKTLADGDKAVAIFNRTAAPLKATLTAHHLKYLAGRGRRASPTCGRRDDRLPRRARLRAGRPPDPDLSRERQPGGSANGLYLSEMPGAVNPAETA
jgi:hypothetical protein